jgi:hypothetical protein
MISITPVNENVVDEANIKAIQLKEVAVALEIKCQEDLEESSKKLNMIKTAYRDIEAERRKITVPIDNAKKAVQTLFLKPLNLLKEAEKIFKDAMARYLAEKERERVKEQVKAVKEAEANDEPPPIVPVKVEKVQGLSTRKVWKAEILEDDYDKIPREYLIPNMAVLDKIGQSTKGQIKIPGIKFIEETIVISK